MVASVQVMAKDSEEQERSVWIAEDVRARWLARREKLEIPQREFAARIGTSPGTISNVETGKQKTLPRSLYARWERALFRKGQGVSDDKWNQLIDLFLDSDDDEADQLIAMAAIIRKKEKKQE